MNQREQRLLAAFLLVLVATVTWLGWTRLRDEQARLRGEAEVLRREAEAARGLMDAYSGKLAGADAWMKQRVGAPVSSQEASTRLLRAVQESARSAGLQLANTKFLTPYVRGPLRLSRYSATVTGVESAIYPWLATFHDPDKLRCVSGLTIRPDKEDETIVICEVEFALWYEPAKEDEI